MKKIAALVAFTMLIGAIPTMTYADSYDKGSDTFYSDREDGCYDDYLRTAKNIVIDTSVTRTGLDKLLVNENLESLSIKDVSNLSDEDLHYLYPYLARGNIAMAAVLVSYGDYYSSFGNDGTSLYKRVMKELCPSVVTLRSCASVVSAALVAAGVQTYASAGTAGLVEYFESTPEWANLGAATEEELLPGDIIFIDRKSHASEYQTGVMEDAEYTAEEEFVYEYNGGYDATGHKNYETEDPTGSSYEVFSPDQDGDGEVGEWEAEYWKCYWERVNADGYVPPYEYYYVWEEDARAKEEAEKQKKRQEEEERRAAEEASKAKKQQRRAASGRIIHDHIFVWTGNEAIQQRFPGSTGNIVSGSYTENYANARSAAISKYNFTGDYRVYRYMGYVGNTVSPNSLERWKQNTVSVLESLKTQDEDSVLDAIATQEAFEQAAAEARAKKLEEEREALRKKRKEQKLDLIRRRSLGNYIMSSVEQKSEDINFLSGRLMQINISPEDRAFYSGSILND